MSDGAESILLSGEDERLDEHECMTSFTLKRKYLVHYLVLRVFYVFFLHHEFAALLLLATLLCFLAPPPAPGLRLGTVLCA